MLFLVLPTTPQVIGPGAPRLVTVVVWSRYLPGLALLLIPGCPQVPGSLPTASRLWGLQMHEEAMGPQGPAF